MTRLTPSSNTSTDAPLAEPLPEIDLRQLLRLTDDTGIFQHATHLLPDPTHGYCTDDNARALIAAVLHAELRGYDEHSVPLQRYLAFLGYAFNPDTGRFRNFMSYDRRWLEEAGSEDSHGRAIWALGVTVQRAPSEPIRDFADQLLHRGLAAVRDQLDHLHPRAFSLLGLSAYLEAQDHPAVREVRDQLAERLYALWCTHASDDWPWWEDILTWGIARLPQAMLVAGHAMGRPEMVEAALRALAWCLEVQTAPDGHLSIVGNQGWYRRGQAKAPFDQQPLEAHGLVDACLVAGEIDPDPAQRPHWVRCAWRCFQWFLGDNDLRAPLYHPETGGCQDGLTARGPNQNQGAESSLAYVLSLLALHRFRQRRTGRVTVTGPRSLGLGVIGASRFARFCLEQFASVEGVKPVAVWNRTYSRARDFAHLPQHDGQPLKAYEHLEELLGDPDVHLVHVATPPVLHVEHAIAALQAGKHVLCEKPIATNLVDAQRMIQAATERDRRLAVNHTMRYGPLVEAVGHVIESGALGAPLRGVFVNQASDAQLPPDHWFWDESVSGGIFIEHGVHVFDLARAWLGEASVMDAWQLRRPGTNVIDQAGCDLRYGSQTSVGFYHGFHQPDALDRQELRLIFERGEMQLTGWIASQLTVHALLSEDQFEQLQQLLPDAAVQTLRVLDGQAHRPPFRHREETLDREVRLELALGESPEALYDGALRALMSDLVTFIADPRHRMRGATIEHARGALELAMEANRLAKGGFA